MIKKSDLIEAITNQKNVLFTQQSYPRKMLDKIKILPHFALVVSGIRRSGKSTLLTQLIEKQGENSYLFLNFDTPLLFEFEFSDFSLLDTIIAENPDRKSVV